MNSDLIIREIRKDLNKLSSSEGQASFNRFFKEKVKCYGVKSAEVGKIDKKYWKLISNWSKNSIFNLCETLLASDYSEAAFIASSFSSRLGSQFTKDDFKIFERWVYKYINNWAKCDGFCTGSVGSFVTMYPGYVKELKRWAKTNNIWVKRASAVSLIPLARKGKYLKEVFEISDILLLDTADMVQKGYGWLLKEASRKHEKEVLNYVVEKKKIMPRTALRYAIELMPKKLKVRAMKKE
jgi:3-methyladenine DNA glycosylase AlkD